MGVWTKSETKNEKTTTAETGSHKGNTGDGLLGSLIAEQFFTAVLGPIFPALFHGVSVIDAIDMADEAWMDRRTKKAAADKAPEFSYFPSYNLGYGS